MSDRHTLIRIASGLPVGDQVRRAILGELRRTAGSHDFQVSGRGSNPETVFRALRDDDLREHGHDAYSGTIGQKGGYTIKSRDPMTRDETRAFIESTIDRADKWGDALAVPYGREKVLNSKEYTIRVQARDQRSAIEAAREAIAAKGRSRKGAQVEVIGIRAEMIRPGGVAKTGFEADKKAWFTAGSAGSRFNSRKDALTAAKKWLSEGNLQHRVGDTITISQVVQLGYVKKLSEATRLATWTVTGTRRQVAIGKIEGWIFYGWAAS